jgi:dolichol-phosphate mannosyltransferase
VVRDVPMPARYADEVSNIRISAIVGPFAFKHMTNFFQRVLGQYFVRDFHVASLELLAGLGSLSFGIGYTAHYLIANDHTRAASAGVVMAAALPIILGAQLLMQAMNFDVLNVPTRPIHPYLRTIARMDAEETPA